MIQPTPTTAVEVADFLDGEPTENQAAWAFGRTAAASTDPANRRRTLWARYVGGAQ